MELQFCIEHEQPGYDVHCNADGGSSLTVPLSIDFSSRIQRGHPPASPAHCALADVEQMSHSTFRISSCQCALRALVWCAMPAIRAVGSCRLSGAMNLLGQPRVDV
jgi:hypothetical protein